MNVDVVPALKCSKWPESSDYRQNPFPHNKVFFSASTNISIEITYLLDNF